MRWMRLTVSLLLAVILLNGCSDSFRNECRIQNNIKEDGVLSELLTQEGRSYQVLSAKSFQGTIFSKESQGEGLRLQVKEYWTPSKDDILEAEESLGAYLLSAKDTLSLSSEEAIGICRDLSKYKRQYVGIIEHGRKKIYINLFRTDILKDVFNWKTQGVWVLGSGYAFFKVEYDPTSGEWSKLIVNSPR